MTSNLISNDIPLPSPSNKTKALQELMGAESNDEDRTKLTRNFDPQFINLLQDSRAMKNIGSNNINGSSQLSGTNQYQSNSNDLMLINGLINNNTNNSSVNNKKEEKEKEAQNDAIDLNKKKQSAYFTSVKKNKKKAKPNFQVVQKNNVNNKEDNSSFFNEIIFNNLRPTDDVKQTIDEKCKSNNKQIDGIDKEKENNIALNNKVNTIEDQSKDNYQKSDINNNNNNEINNGNQFNCNTNADLFKEHYLNQLILAADKLISEGIITLDYLIEPVIENNKKDQIIKCENKLCKAIIHNSSDKYDTIIYNSIKVISLCRECFKAKEAGNYCHYCNIIYREFKAQHGSKDNKGWIQCDYCPKWQHIQCEMQKGTYRNLARLNNPRFKYMCPICRMENNSNIKNNSANLKQKRQRENDNKCKYVSK